LSYALQTMQHGIWGGTTGDERAAMRAIARHELAGRPFSPRPGSSL
jgi:hypothetical protein